MSVEGKLHDAQSNIVQYLINSLGNFNTEDKELKLYI